MRILSNYCLKSIFDFIERNRVLNIIKYNKKLQKKLDVSKYDYIRKIIEKKYLYIYSKPTLYQYLYENNIIKTLNIEKIHDLINKITEDYKTKYDFQLKETKDDKTLLLNKQIDFTSKVLDNVFHLSISKLEKVKIPISAFKNLESIFLQKIKDATFINDILENGDKPLILNKMKNLKLFDVYIRTEKNFRLEFPNLIFLDLTNKRKKYCFLKNIFGFNFAYNFLKINFHNFDSCSYDKSHKNSFQKVIFEDETFPKNLETFQMNDIKKDKYGNGRIEYIESHIKSIKMEKLKNNKIKYTYHVREQESDFILNELKEIRISNNKDGNYINKIKEVYLSGKYIYNRKDCKETTNFDINKINRLVISTLDCYDENEDLVTKTGQNYIKIFKYINNDNFLLNYINFDFLDIALYPNFIEKIKLLKNLFEFKAKKCITTRSYLFKLFKSFSLLKLIGKILIIVHNIALNENEQRKIADICPISIEIKVQGKNTAIKCNSEGNEKEEEDDIYEEEEYSDQESKNKKKKNAREYNDEEEYKMDKSIMEEESNNDDKYEENGYSSVGIFEDSDLDISEENNKNKFELEEKSSEDLGEILEKIYDSNYSKKSQKYKKNSNLSVCDNDNNINSNYENDNDSDSNSNSDNGSFLL